MNTENSLQQLLRKHAQRIRSADAKAVQLIRKKGDESGYDDDSERVARGVFYSFKGLVREALEAEFGTRFRKYLHRKTGQAMEDP